MAENLTQAGNGSTTIQKPTIHFPVITNYSSQADRAGELTVRTENKGKVPEHSAISPALLRETLLKQIDLRVKEAIAAAQDPAGIGAESDKVRAATARADRLFKGFIGLGDTGELAQVGDAELARKALDEFHQIVINIQFEGPREAQRQTYNTDMQTLRNEVEVQQQ